jgi:hypothetical protein
VAVDADNDAGNDASQDGAQAAAKDAAADADASCIADNLGCISGPECCSQLCNPQTFTCSPP